VAASAAAAADQLAKVKQQGEALLEAQSKRADSLQQQLQVAQQAAAASAEEVVQSREEARVVWEYALALNKLLQKLEEGFISAPQSRSGLRWGFREDSLAQHLGWMWHVHVLIVLMF
jgi:hypothetical protein